MKYVLWFSVAAIMLAGGPMLAAQEPVKADGSSTVYLITEAVAEEFQTEHRPARVTVGISGTGGGFKKFGTGETDVSNASRPIKKTEIELCAKNGIEYIELPVAYDGIAVVVNPKNTWCDSMTVAELKKLWQPEAKGRIMKWSDVRAGWPDKPVRLYGPGTDSGTFDYFTETVCGKERASRPDFTASEDDNTLVQGVASDEGALGYFGLAYYEANVDKLKLVAVDDERDENGKGPIAPAFETIVNGTYQPLSRPLFIYVNKKSADRHEVREFVKFYLSMAKTLAPEVGYVPLPDDIYELARKRFEGGVTGTVYVSDGAKKATLKALYSGEYKDKEE